ncbi:DUF317 domain-containing protein [Kitasatospora sp. MAP5-34]|uniref:DUF317 domain-containing protein n=1 Tax=Kitasatospora sp. MAP5-34 TaxID=3035102 RepID=UPI00247439A6|nr:DUF317 domain-containing protein [Kitasatospora sp. MAP5-34]MDH6580739.1 hypothetical protein [Kitasatospora sp. MAP5-34]
MTDTPATFDAPPDTLPAPPAPEPVGTLEREQWEVHVSPRYLAGSGYESDETMAPLCDAGWNAWSDELANFHVTSPCGRAYLGFLPESNPEPVGLWKAWVRPHHHGPRTWMAAFSDEMPYEFMRAFTADWAEGYRPDEPTFAHPDDGHRDGIEKVLNVLRDAGWDRDPQTGPGRALERWTAPDGRAGVEVRVHARGSVETEILQGQPRWTIWAAPAPYRRPLWDAVFSSGTPTGLIAAFCRALADPAPLIREDEQIPRACRDLITRA